MANAKIEALKEQLKIYSSKIDIYEKAFLANDGKIDTEEQKTLDNIRGMLTAINTKIQSKKVANNSVEKTTKSKQNLLTEEAVKNKVYSLFLKLKTMASA